MRFLWTVVSNVFHSAWLFFSSFTSLRFSLLDDGGHKGDVEGVIIPGSRNDAMRQKQSWDQSRWKTVEFPTFNPHSCSSKRLRGAGICLVIARWSGCNKASFCLYEHINKDVFSHSLAVVLFLDLILLALSLPFPALSCAAKRQLSWSSLEHVRWHLSELQQRVDVIRRLH